MKIKVCGMTMMEQLKTLEEIGADYAGLIFYPRSPRYVLHAALKAEEVKSRFEKIKLVGVFVNEELDSVLEKIDTWGLDSIQLHGQESPAYCRELRNRISVIKAFRVGVDTEIAAAVEPYADAVDHFLFDTLGMQYGGTGQQFEWDLLLGAKIPQPYILSGGIGPDDAEKVRAFVEKDSSAYALDLNSRFETDPGVKDLDLIDRFIKEVKTKTV